MKKYTVISNISYALKNIWRWDKKFYLFFIPAIPMAVLMPLAASYFPKVLIDSIESGKSIRNIIFIICAYFGMLLIINLLDRLCDSRLCFSNSVSDEGESPKITSGFASFLPFTRLLSGSFPPNRRYHSKWSSKTTIFST